MPAFIGMTPPARTVVGAVAGVDVAVPPVGAAATGALPTRTAPMVVKYASRLSKCSAGTPCLPMPPACNTPGTVLPGILLPPGWHFAHFV